jgi:hypothetical protein
MVVKRDPRDADPNAPVDLTHKVLPVDQDVRAKHSWRAPPPGQGGRRQRICAKCGQRLSVVGAESMCPGRQQPGLTETIHDYDPF